VILPTIHELSILGVADAGVPNAERIVIRPAESINLAAVGLYLGVVQTNGFVQPVHDHFFWFGELVVAPPSWLFVFTGRGSYRQSQVPDTGHVAYTFHWNKPYTLFGTPGVVPVLFRYDGIAIGSVAPARQLAR
jgi:hypothetical protein